MKVSTTTLAFLLVKLSAVLGADNGPIEQELRKLEENTQNLQFLVNAGVPAQGVATHAKGQITSAIVVVRQQIATLASAVQAAERGIEGNDLERAKINLEMASEVSCCFATN